MYDQPQDPQRRGACLYCRQKKIKCTGEVTCKSCAINSQSCFYPRSRRGRKQTQTTMASPIKTSLNSKACITRKQCDRDAHAPAGATTMAQQGLLSASISGRSVLSPSVDSNHEAIASMPSSSAGPPQWFLDIPAVAHAANTTFSSLLPPQSGLEVSGGHEPSDYSHAAGTTGIGVETTSDGDDHEISIDTLNWEHHGPSSWLSICSVPGTEWVCDRTGDVKFQSIARSFLNTMKKRIKLRIPLSVFPTEAPDPVTAQLYKKAFFEYSFPALYGIVDRTAFEAHLQANSLLAGQDDREPSWFALRNMIWAFGCRKILSVDRSKSFWDCHKQAWGFFENAMTVHTELLYTPTTLVAVQALALMTFFVDGLGGPVLEYMLSSSMMRLAQSKGLHRRPSKGWKLSEMETQRRSYLFWAIYCCEKAVISRSGRTSAINDAEITCEAPSVHLPESTADLEFCLEAIKHARIASRISTTISSAIASIPSTSDIFETVHLLDQDLQRWRDCLPHALGSAQAHSGSVNRLRNDGLLVHYFESCYLTSMLQLHSAFYYPWTLRSFARRMVFPSQIQSAHSASRVADIARRSILTTDSTNLCIDSSHSHKFYLPILSAFILFITIVQNPVSSTALKDIAILEIAAGHFARLEVITEFELSFPVVREMAEISREVFKRRSQKQNQVMLECAPDDPGLSNNVEGDNLDGFNYWDGIELDLDCWNVLTTSLS